MLLAQLSIGHQRGLAFRHYIRFLGFGDSESIGELHDGLPSSLCDQSWQDRPYRLQPPAR